MDLTKFYSDKKRLAYNPNASVLLNREGVRKLVSFDDRHVTIITKLKGIIEDFVERKSRNVRVLNIGVGNAVYERYLQNEVDNKVDFYGVDISRTQLKRAKKYLKEARRVDIDIQKLPYGDNFFDIVILSEILEHLFFPEYAISEAIRVLKQEGYIFLTYPNSGALQLRLSLLLTGASPLLNYSNNKEHIRFFNKTDILNLVEGKVGPKHFRGLSSFLFDKWNFPIKIVTPRIFQVVGNIFFPQLALGHFMIFQK